jgi:hypothetical protein
MAEKSSSKKVDRLVFKPVPKIDPIEIEEDPEPSVGKTTRQGCLRRLISWVQQSKDEPLCELLLFCLKRFK